MNSSDFSTPIGAILALEAAYRARDLEAAIACKDFMAEAELMLRRMNKLKIDEQIVTETADVLELTFRRFVDDRGFPALDGVESRFPYTETLADNLVIVTELCYFPDGHITEQKLIVAKGAHGWRVLNPLTKYGERPSAA
jgi:hypothetical protein